LFLCMILLAAWLGGAGPGLLATALSILALDYYCRRRHDQVGGHAGPIITTGGFDRDGAMAKTTSTYTAVMPSSCFGFRMI
jgi:hypothetical protein